MKKQPKGAAYAQALKAYAARRRAMRRRYAVLRSFAAVGVEFGMSRQRARELILSAEA
jgi:hypothetical protein